MNKLLIVTLVMALLVSCTNTTAPESETKTQTKNDTLLRAIVCTQYKGDYTYSDPFVYYTIFTFDTTKKQLSFTRCKDTLNPDAPDTVEFSEYAKGYYQFDENGMLTQKVSSKNGYIQYFNAGIMSGYSYENQDRNATLNEFGYVIKQKFSGSFYSSNQGDFAFSSDHTIDYSYYPNGLVKTQRIRGTHIVDTILDFTYRSISSINGFSFQDSAFLLNRPLFDGYFTSPGNLPTFREQRVVLELYPSKRVKAVYYPTTGDSSLQKQTYLPDGQFGGMETIILPSLKRDETKSWAVYSYSEIVIDPKTGKFTLTPVM